MPAGQSERESGIFSAPVYDATVRAVEGRGACISGGGGWNSRLRSRLEKGGEKCVPHDASMPRTVGPGSPDDRDAESPRKALVGRAASRISQLAWRLESWNSVRSSAIVPGLCERSFELEERTARTEAAYAEGLPPFTVQAHAALRGQSKRALSRCSRAMIPQDPVEDGAQLLQFHPAIEPQDSWRRLPFRVLRDDDHVETGEAPLEGREKPAHRLRRAVLNDDDANIRFVDHPDRENRAGNARRSLPHPAGRLPEEPGRRWTCT